MIDIFIHQTAKGPAWQAAQGYFTMRITGRDGHDTYTSKKLIREKTTAKIISAELIVNAVYVINIYSSRKGVVTKDAINIHLDSDEALLMCEKYLRQWKQAGWKDKKGNLLPDQYHLLNDMIIRSGRTYTFTKGE